MNDEFWWSPKRNLIFLSRLHQSTNAPICPQRRQEFHIWVWNVRRGCHYDGCFCLTFYLNNSLTLLELLNTDNNYSLMGFIREVFPQEVCHKRTRLTPTKLHRFNSIKVIESLRICPSNARDFIMQRSLQFMIYTISIKDFLQKVCHKRTQLKSKLHRLYLI